MGERSSVASQPGAGADRVPDGSDSRQQSSSVEGTLLDSGTSGGDCGAEQTGPVQGSGRSGAGAGSVAMVRSSDPPE